MTQKTYLFYDIESSGLNKSFDQVFQFAAIRTDLEFNELERHEIFVKVNPDCIPTPMASITHQISLKTANQKGLPEIDAMQQIHALLNTPGTISLGYNTLNFDDEFLRFSFWRNLLSPYSHQWANHCGRMDIYPLVLMYYLFKPDVIDWPMKDDGKPSMKLEAISALNQLAEGPAHDALVDVIATVELAKRLAQDKTMWEYCAGYFNKAIDQQRLNQLPVAVQTEGQSLHYGLMVWNKLGNRDQFQAPVLGLGQHFHYKNQTIWLRLDMPDLQKLTLENIAEYCQGEFTKRQEVLSIIRKKYAEPPFILPPKDRFLQNMKEERLNLVKENLAWCQQNIKLLAIIANYYREECYPVVLDADVDSILYQADFMTQQEQKRSLQFHQEKPEQRASMIEQFTNPNYREMAIRAIGRYDKAQLSDKQRKLFEDYLSQVWTHHPEQALMDYRETKRLTASEALLEVARLKKADHWSDAQKALLDELEGYYQGYL